MNPHRDRAIEIRRRALVDQVQGLREHVASGGGEAHTVRRLRDTQAELAVIKRRGVSWPQRRVQG